MSRTWRPGEARRVVLFPGRCATPFGVFEADTPGGLRYLRRLARRDPGGITAAYLAARAELLARGLIRGAG